MTGRAPRRLEHALVAALAAAGVVVWLIARPVPNYDSYYSLLWGRDLIHGVKPDFHAYEAPTHHPLFVALSAVLALFGEHADDLLVLFCVLAFVVLVWGVYRLGSEVFGRWAGLVSALLVLGSPTIALYAARAYVDVPFLAVVVWAGAVEARAPRERPVLVMSLLTVAGLLRPEAWLLAGFYWLWIGWRRWPLLALAAVAPVVWGLVDLIATGDPLFSLHATSDLADEIHRTRGAGAVPHALLSYLDGTVRAPVVLAGVIGAVWLVVAWRRAGRPVPAGAHVPLALLAGGVITFCATGVAGLSLLPRYLTVPAVALCLLTGPVVVWLVAFVGRHAGGEAAVAAVAVVVAGAVVYAVGGGSVRRAVAELRFVHRSHHRLEQILATPAVRAGRACGPISLPNYRLVPDSRWVLHASGTEVIARSDHGVPSGVALVVRGSKAISRFGRADGASPADNDPPAGFARRASNATFVAYVRCLR